MRSSDACGFHFVYFYRFSFGRDASLGCHEWRFCVHTFSGVGVQRSGFSMRLFIFLGDCTPISNHSTCDSEEPLISAWRQLRHGSNNRNVYHNIFCNTTRYMNSFFPDAVKLWNNIGDDFHSCNSIEIFKKNITNLIRPPSKPIYSVHDPIGVKYVFQLRVGLSPLRSHKKL